MGIYHKKRNTKHVVIYSIHTHYNIQTDNELYAKHYEEMSDAAAVAYEVPQQSVQHESVYEMEPQSKMYATTEVVYEPVTDMNIYSTPELPSKVRTLLAKLLFTVRTI